MISLLPCVVPLFALLLESGNPAGPQALQDAGPETSPIATAATAESIAIGAALRASRSAPAGNTAEFVRRVTKAGPGALAAAFDVLVQRVVPEAEAGDPRQVLSAPQRTILLQALARFPQPDVRAHVAARLRAEAADPGAVRLAAVHVLGVVGTAADLQRLPALAPRKSDENESLTRDARSAVHDACAAILRRDPRAWSVVSDVVRTTDRSAARSLLEAVGSGPDPRALEVLFRSVTCHPDLSALAVASVLTVGPSLDGEITREFADWMAHELPSARKEHRQGLLQAIGALDDGSHAQVLIDALEDDEPEVREAAAWALRRTTGFGYPATPEPWRAWLSDELRWNEVERERARAELESKDPSRVVAALRAYAGRRAWRESLAEDVAIVLQRDEPGLQLAACEVLQGLNAHSAIRPMASLLEAPEKGVRDAAHRALVSISGLELPQDARLAMEALDLL